MRPARSSAAALLAVNSGTVFAARSASSTAPVGARVAAQWCVHQAPSVLEVHEGGRPWRTRGRAGRAGQDAMSWTNRMNEAAPRAIASAEISTGVQLTGKGGIKRL
ncbi:hypothetical protein GGX14DRAFT_472905, partial [Mycena pura]